MRLYEGAIKTFNNDVLLNRIADLIANEYRKHLHKRPSDSEYNSWRQSLNHLNNTFTVSELRENQIVIEYGLPLSSGRIDVLMFGKDHEKRDSIVLVELKQWSNNSVRDCENEGNVLARFERGWTECAHPSLQVQNYQSYLREFMTVFQEDPALMLQPCAYCHNYSKVQQPAVLDMEKYSNLRATAPVFYKEDVKAFGDYLKERLNSGNGTEVFNRFIRSPIRPSKKLLDHTSDMINKQQIFTLIDDQITAYNAIKSMAKKKVRSGEKSVIIVKGGPGTGKSVIALEVMAELMRMGIPVYHATGSSAFTNSLREILGPRINRYPVRKFFNFFFSFTRSPDDSIDVIMCDEAHRIRKDSNDFGVPFKFKSKNPQIDDLIRPAKLSVFFIDEQQIVRPKEKGSIKLIKKAARRFNIDKSRILEYELTTQFRCSGSDTYLQWVEKMLGLQDSDITAFETKMEFKIIESPHELKRIIDEKNAVSARRDKARLVAGFCWPWSEPKQDGTLINDVKIGDFEMPWENKSKFWTFATHPEGADQIGTVYTSQGFEFDYIGIIWGPDLVYDLEASKWNGQPEKSYDSATKKNNSEFTLHLKHVYRVLLTRAHKGVYVYFMDKTTERFFKSRVEKPVVDVSATRAADTKEHYDPNRGQPK